MERKSVYGALPAPVLTEEHKALVKTGKVYSLQHTMEPGIPVFGGHAPFVIMPYRRHFETDGMLEGPAGFASEFTMMGQHTGTHIDALCHISKRVGDERYFHGGVPVSGTQDHNGIAKLSIEQMPPIVTRGVLLDVAGLLGVDVLADSFDVTDEHLRACETRQGVKIEPGDCTVIHTGFGSYWKRENDRFLTRHAGANLAAARYMVEQGAIAVGGDTSTFERLPSPRHDVHVYLLVDSGVPIMECLNLAELVRDQVYEFLLIVTPLKLKGATGSVIHPLAIA